VSPHEKFLDGWRIAITAALVGALFLVIVLILLRESVAASATPYVSLFSGLAGIALGLMFASAAGAGPTGTPGRGRGGSRPRIETVPPPPAALPLSGTAPGSAPTENATRRRPTTPRAPDVRGD